MVFVDTSGIFAVLDRDDQNHRVAAVTWGRLLDSGRPLFTTNYVVVEICALAQRRFGLHAVRTIHEDVLSALEIHWMVEADHELAMTALLAASRRKLSLVDCASFIAIRRAGARTAFAFDRHFTEEKFVFPR